MLLWLIFAFKNKLYFNEKSILIQEEKILFEVFAKEMDAYVKPPFTHNTNESIYLKVLVSQI